MDTATDKVTDFFESLRSRGHEPLLAGDRGTLRFDLEGPGRTERWLIAIDRGDLDVSHRNAKADCILHVERSLFRKIVAGEVNATTAVLRGAVAVEGPPGLLVSFQRLFPSRAGTAPHPAQSSGRR